MTDKEAISRKLAEKFGVDKERPYFDEDYRFPVKLLLADDTERLIDLALDHGIGYLTAKDDFFVQVIGIIGGKCPSIIEKYVDYPTKRAALNAALCRALLEV